MLFRNFFYFHVSKVKEDVLRGNFNGHIGEFYTCSSCQRPKVTYILLETISQRRFARTVFDIKNHPIRNFGRLLLLLTS